MAEVTLSGNTAHTLGELPDVGDFAPDFTLTKTDLTTASLRDYRGRKVVLNIFPSVDTGTCARSVRQFNKKASSFKNTAVLCISTDLPFAQARFCNAEGIERVEMLSDFRDGNFGKIYQVVFTDGKFVGLLSRSVVVIDEEGIIRYTQQVANTSDEPDYDAALKALTDD